MTARNRTSVRTTSTSVTGTVIKPPMDQLQLGPDLSLAIPMVRMPTLQYTNSFPLRALVHMALLMPMQAELGWPAYRRTNWMRYKPVHS